MRDNKHGEVKPNKRLWFDLKSAERHPSNINKLKQNVSFINFIHQNTLNVKNYRYKQQKKTFGGVL